MVRMHIFPIFLFLAKMLSFLHSKDNIFARNENIGKICKRTITWTDFSYVIMSYLYVKKQATYLPNLDQPFKVVAFGSKYEKNKSVY